jgi:exodeoxyribonuclease VII small subunit
MAREAKRETFEQLYAKLEASVARLEVGGLPLDEAISLYEEGMTLARSCQELLDAAELKITKLKESFAALPDRNGAEQGGNVPDDYEYVSDDDAESAADSPGFD